MVVREGSRGWQGWKEPVIRWLVWMVWLTVTLDRFQLLLILLRSPPSSFFFLPRHFDSTHQYSAVKPKRWLLCGRFQQTSLLVRNNGAWNVWTLC